MTGVAGIQLEPYRPLAENLHFWAIASVFRVETQVAASMVLA